MNTSEHVYIFIPPTSLRCYEDFLIGDEPNAIDDFSIPTFNFHIDSDDDVDLTAPMTCGEYRN